MTFRDREKQRYRKLKAQLFSSKAQPGGLYKGKRRSFCLADDCSVENIHESIRDEIIAYFITRDIPWHEGLNKEGDKPKTLPSNHLCCSPSMCVNCLGPMMCDKELTERVFRVFLPELDEILPFEADEPLSEGKQPFITFEYVGQKTHFDGEKGWPQRGAMCTSLDFAFVFKRYDSRRQLVLGEWKYTEEYKSRRLPKPNEINRTRWNTYEEEFKIWKSGQDRVPAYELFFVEPFYQLMRQALLAQKMEREKELKADIVMHMHVAPKANREFAETFTSPGLAIYGQTVTDAWKNIAPKDRFLPVHAESLLTAIEQGADKKHSPWTEWLMKRYGWWRYLCPSREVEFWRHD